MLVIVALNGPDDRPDPSTLKAFRCPSSIGISYHRGAWRESSLPMDKMQLTMRKITPCSFLTRPWIWRVSRRKSAPAFPSLTLETVK